MGRLCVTSEKKVAELKKECLAYEQVGKLPFEDMAHIKLSYDFDLEISPGPVLGF
jgi:hypothetical protein